jgi:hypothetical protein
MEAETGKGNGATPKDLPVAQLREYVSDLASYWARLYPITESFTIDVSGSELEGILADVMIAAPDHPIKVVDGRPIVRLADGRQIFYTEVDANPKIGALDAQVYYPVLGELRLVRPKRNPSISPEIPIKELLVIDVDVIYYPREPRSLSDRQSIEAFGLSEYAKDMPLGGQPLPAMIRFMLTPHHDGRRLVQAMCNPYADLMADPRPLANYFSNLIAEIKKRCSKPVAKKKQGGPYPTPDADKKNTVLGWREVRGKQKKSDYCNEKNIAESTLDRWEDELIQKGLIPPPP